MKVSKKPSSSKHSKNLLIKKLHVRSSKKELSLSEGKCMPKTHGPKEIVQKIFSKQRAHKRHCFRLTIYIYI